MIAEEKALWEGILAAPEDGAAKMVLADWYEDRGYPQTAHALRWCASRKLHPDTSPAGKVASWSRQPKRQPGGRRRKQLPHALPALVYDELQGKPAKGRRVYAGAQSAIGALASALARLRAVTEVNG